MLNILPSLLTIGNFLCGMLSIFSVFHQRIGKAILFICLGCLFDLLDGRAARMFKATSVFGKELDSLSDIVTFGIAPAVLIYNIYSETLGSAALFMALIFSISGLIRLARFNAKHSGLSTFIGMPIPVSAIFLIVLSFVLKPAYLVVATILLSYLMVSHIRFPSFKKKTYEG